MDSLSYKHVNKRVSVVCLLLFLSFLSLSVKAANRQNTLPSQQFMINGAIYQLELAQNRQQLQIGLMGRTFLAKNKGMLFVFRSIRQHGIWMKNMTIPLTVAWLDKHLNVISVKNLFPCKVKKCPVFKPIIPSSFVVELALNTPINVGDRLIIQQ